MRLYGRELTRRALAARAGQFAQFAGVRLLVHEDGPARGVRVLEFRSGSGLRFTVLPDRAFDIHECDHAGRAVGWHSPVGVRHPALMEHDGEAGLGWLRGFSGLLATCGLDHAGFMESDRAEQYDYPARREIRYGLHGRIANTPGTLIGYGEAWDGDTCVLFCEGEVRQAAVFGEHLVLRRRIEVACGSDTIVIRDRVRNAGFARTPHMILYHFNVGYPVIDEGSQYLAPIADTVWAAHADRLRAQEVGYRTCPAPRERFVEQVFEHRMQEGADGIVPVAVVNPALGFGVLLQTKRAQLPCHLQWQCFQAGLYAMGIEPGTNHAGGNGFARERGELIELAHGEERPYELRFTVLPDAAAVAAAEAELRAIAPPPAEAYPRPSGAWEQLGTREGE